MSKNLARQLDKLPTEDLTIIAQRMGVRGAEILPRNTLISKIIDAHEEQIIVPAGRKAIIPTSHRGRGPFLVEGVEPLSYKLVGTTTKQERARRRRAKLHEEYQRDMAYSNLIDEEGPSHFTAVGPKKVRGKRTQPLAFVVQPAKKPRKRTVKAKAVHKVKGVRGKSVTYKVIPGKAKGKRHCIEYFIGPSGKERCKKYSKTGNPWIAFVKAFAAKHKITYSEALRDPKTSKAYKSRK